MIVSDRIGFISSLSSALRRRSRFANIIISAGQITTDLFVFALLRSSFPLSLIESNFPEICADDLASD